MRRTYRYDADADMVYEVGSNYFEERKESGPAVIGDGLPGGIHGMRSHADGRVYDSKAAYYGSVRRAGCEVVGNDSMASIKPPDLIGKREIGETVKRAIDEVRQFGDQAADRARTMER